MIKTFSIVTAVLCLVASGLLVLVVYLGYSVATEQKSFPTAQAAAQALVNAAEANDIAGLTAIFGSKGKQILDSGDPIQDRNRRAIFVQEARRSMKVEADPADPSRSFVLIGDDQFPFPVPIRQAAGRWRFDVQDGEREVLARRIGGNEIDAIRLATAYVAAQRQFAAEDHDRSGVHEYAMRFISSPGKRDGLYWSQAEGGPITPISDLVTQAAEEGYDTSGEKPVPYHGYRFQMLTGQGANAQGGAADYMVQGLLIGGFGLVACPIEYGVSGIQTFVVNQQGVVYEKDLGKATPALASTMKTFNPDSSWKAVQ
jgi:hypothetical protein